MILDCAPAGEITPICGLANPEDLVAVPGANWLIVSQMAGGGGSSGSLAALHARDSRVVRLYPPEDHSLEPAADLPEASWGDPTCVGPPAPERFAPHGIDLALQTGEPPTLLVVNHGGRETIEVFELRSQGAGQPALRWRGCVELPGGTLPNDVAALPDAGFVVTNMAPGREGLSAWWSGVRMALGWTTGDVLEWLPEGGWRVIAGSASSGPNGVAVAPDGATLYVAEYGTSRILGVSRHAGGPTRSPLLAFKPDNLSWSPDGRLLAAGQAAPLSAIIGCFELEQGTCGLAFGVAALDPGSLATLRSFHHAGTAGIGAVTVALGRGERIYLGTFHGDRVAWIPASALVANP